MKMWAHKKSCAKHDHKEYLKRRLDGNQFAGMQFSREFGLIKRLAKKGY